MRTILIIRWGSAKAHAGEFLITLFVLPGITYQFISERIRGPVPGEQVLGERVLRAITATVALDAIYFIVAGPQLIRLILPVRGQWFAVAAGDPRWAATLTLVIFIVVPALAAWAMGQVERRRYPSRFDPVPTAWDSLFRGRSSVFVRARLKSGAWVGGWYGIRSSASAYPNAPDLYLESAYEMGSDGSFGPRVADTAGLYLRLEDIEVVEFIKAKTPTAEVQADSPLPEREPSVQ